VKKVLPLVFGWTTYITEEVEVTPALDILVVTSQPLTTGWKNQRQDYNESPCVALGMG
jgi:hypothetical protein